MEELLRLVAAAGILGLVCAGAAGVRTWSRNLAARHRGAHLGDLADRLGLPPGRPSIIYVWSERCAQCVQLQEPALVRLERERGVFVRKVHALEAPEVVRRFNILTVPSTVVVDGERRVRAVNFGFADAEALAAQLA